MGFGGLQRGQGLAQLVIQLGGVDLGQQRAGFDTLTNVHKPLLHIAADTGVNQRAVVGLQVARQDQAAGLAVGLGVQGVHRCDVVLCTGLGQAFEFRDPAMDAAHGHADGGGQGHATDQHKTRTQTLGLRGFEFVGRGLVLTHRVSFD